jgi:peroxiredoxin
LASYARTWDRFEAAGVAVAAIVVDPIENNRAMVDKLLLPFPILSDPDGVVIREWGLLNPAEAGIARPATFAIRSDGSIPYSHIGVDYTDRPPDGELFRGLEEVTAAGSR